MFRRLLAVLLTIVAILAAGWLSLRRPDIPFETLETAYALEDSKFLTLETGYKAHYRDVGPRDAPVVVLVHGFAASLHTWLPLSERLSDDYRVISLDLPGHGLTRGFDEETVSISGFVEYVHDVTQALGVDRFTLVGSSMGGATSWNFALSHGERLEGLVLIGASGWPRLGDDVDDRPLIFQLMANPAARYLIKDLDMSSLVRSGLERSFGDPALATEEMAARYAALSRAPGHREALLALSSPDSGRPTANVEAMAGISTPTLVIHGDIDAVVPVSGGERFGESILNARLEIYEGVGHLPHEETPDRVARDVRMLLARLQASTPQSLAAVEGAMLGEGARP